MTAPRGACRQAGWWRIWILGSTFVMGALGQIAEPVPLSSDEVLARVGKEAGRRHVTLKQYSASRQYTLHNPRFGKQAAVIVLMKFQPLQGAHYTVVTRSGSDSLNSVIDKLLASEMEASLPSENASHQISAANYRVRLLGIETVSERSCYVLELSPKIKSPFLIIGKAWIDAGTFGVVRLVGQFAASTSMLLGAPTMSEDFVEVHGFWLPERVPSVTSSLLLGATEMDILVSNYQFEDDVQIPAAAAPKIARDRQ